MLLRVSKRAGMWGYCPFWFTFADPKPQKIDLTELDELTRDKINLAIAQGALLQVDESGEPLKIARKQTQAVQRPVVNEAQTGTVEVSPVIARKLSELLKNGVTTLRREIPLIKSYQMLSTTLQFEKENKNRKTVIALLQKAIEKIGNVKMYDDLIKDEEVETVVFKIEDMILESSDESVVVEEGSDNELIKKTVKKEVEEL